MVSCPHTGDPTLRKWAHHQLPEAEGFRYTAGDHEGSRDTEDRHREVLGTGKDEHGCLVIFRVERSPRRIHSFASNRHKKPTGTRVAHT